MGYMCYTCRFEKTESTVCGVRKNICTHPKRPSLDGLFSKILRLFFGPSNSCIAVPGYDRNCPLYESLPKPPPPPVF